MTRLMRVAVVGAWHVHAKDYVRDCIDNPQTELVAVWDENAERGRPFAEANEVPFVGSLDEMLADPELDGVIITTATSQHKDVMLNVIAAGKHIFTEKVLAATLADAREIAIAARKAEVVLTVSLPRLYTGYTRAIDEILLNGTLGDVNYVRARVVHDGAVSRNGQEGWLPETFFDAAEALGGAMIDFGAHPYYLVHHWAGMPESVTAHYLRASGHSVEDQGVVVCEYPGHLTAVAEASFMGGMLGQWVEIHGSEGSLLFDFDHGLRTRTRLQSVWESHDIPEDSPKPFDRWVNAVFKREFDDENVAAALALTELAAAAERSAAERRPVRVREQVDE